MVCRAEWAVDGNPGELNWGLSWLKLLEHRVLSDYLLGCWHWQNHIEPPPTAADFVPKPPEGDRDSEPNGPNYAASLAGGVGKIEPVGFAGGFMDELGFVPDQGVVVGGLKWTDPPADN